jgi:hypothetical protein
MSSISLWTIDRCEDTPPLTESQQHTASAIGASECLGTGRRDGAVFLYTHRGARTDRWLVDRGGAVLDRTVLHHGSAF